MCICIPQQQQKLIKKGDHQHVNKLIAATKHRAKRMLGIFSWGADDMRITRNTESTMHGKLIMNQTDLIKNLTALLTTHNLQLQITHFSRQMIAGELS